MKGKWLKKFCNWLKEENKRIIYLFVHLLLFNIYNQIKNFISNNLD